MKARMVVCFLVLAGLLMGCSASKAVPTMEPARDRPVNDSEWAADEAKSDISTVSGGAPAAQEPSPSVGETVTRMIIYNGEIALVVEDTVASQEKITTLASEWGGYISNASSYAYEGGLTRITLTVRVPAEKFNDAMAALRAMALEISRENIGSQDVTQEYVDLESRLKALEAKAARLEELMEQAEDTEAVLAVYEQLSATQQEIEQTKGRMQYLERMAAMATITVTLTPDEMSRPIEIAGWRPAGTLKRAFEALINTFQFLVDALIWIVIWVAPVFAFIGLVLFGLIKALGLIFKRRKPKAPVASEPPIK
ncbi:MAG TPA: DUF4349 domain-containing protein [Anaerolineae bacterium]|nr:DUF4349 domain-containing protein [Anaerolineae bacterium]